MQAYKPTTIHASLFPAGDAAEDERVGHVPGDASKSKKTRRRLKKSPKSGRVLRDFGDEGEERAVPGSSLTEPRSCARKSDETTSRAPVELENESVKLKNESVEDLLMTSCPKSLILLVREPTILAFGLWIAYAWFLTFLFLPAIPLPFQHTSRAWPEGNGSLPYIALTIGCFIGSRTSRWTDSIYDRKREENNGMPVPEYRLLGAMFFAWLMPAGPFIFSFAQYGLVHWMGPTVALVLILGVRYQFAGLLLSLVASLALPLPYLLFKYGERIRAKSKFARSNEALEKERTTEGDGLEGRPKIAREATYPGSFLRK
ncbi:hypothetical protein JCM10295v2_005345 [Rhodotorula toruloides]